MPMLGLPSGPAWHDTAQRAQHSTATAQRAQHDRTFLRASSALRFLVTPEGWARIEKWRTEIRPVSLL